MASWSRCREQHLWGEKIENSLPTLATNDFRKKMERGLRMSETLYFAEKNVKDTLGLLARYGKKAFVLAGGTDLVPRINYYKLKPEVLVYIGNLGLDYIREKGGRLLVGAATPLAKIAASRKVAKKAGALAEAAQLAATAAVRTTATIGGNLANASPAADLAIPLLAMDADLRLQSEKGERMVALKDFFKGPGKTLLKTGELIIEVSLPLPEGNCVFLKLGRRKALSLSVVNTAVRLDVSGGLCREARIAVGAVAPKPLRCFEAEALLMGRSIDLELISRCAAMAIAACRPMDDRRASAWYRKEAGTALVARALARAAGIETSEELIEP
jgi:carbon-monoxide dehydrogenase medium subunit